MISPVYKNEIHRMYIKETTSEDVVSAMYKAHEAQMRKNAKAKKKARTVYENQIQLCCS